MKKIKLRYVLLSVILVILIIAGTAIYMIAPVKDISNTVKPKYSSMKEFELSKVMDTINNIDTGGIRDIPAVITEDDINQVIAMNKGQLLLKSSGPVRINRLKAEISSKNVCIYADVKLYNIIPSQFMIEMVPEIVDNKIAFEVKQTRIGRISISKSEIMKMLKKSDNSYITVDEEKNLFIINSTLPKQFVFKSIELKDKEADVHMQLVITSIEDLYEIINMTKNK